MVANQVVDVPGIGSTKTLKEFNTWLVGGTYVTKQKHVNPPPLQRSESSEKLKLKIEEMKKKLQEGHRKAIRDRKAEPATARLSRITKKPVQPPRPKSGVVIVKSERNELKTSLIDQITQSNYISMFPPLFTPYDRNNTMLRGWCSDMKHYYGGVSSARNHTKEKEEKGFDPQHQTETRRSGRATVSTGRPGFFPTGTRYVIYSCSDINVLMNNK